ncbi:MAG TPA: hypothetical protein VGW38_17695, partial [Chloroflexota bacterium]|nr:hypothetical protein [Chloroflexota bacterium]
MATQHGLPPFIPGLELCRLYYEEAVRPIMERHFPRLAHGAARIENGSDVLGFDTALSMDHGWGPRLVLYLSESDYSDALRDDIRLVLANDLPFAFRGFPTHFDPPGWCMTPTTEHPISHN